MITRNNTELIYHYTLEDLGGKFVFWGERH